MRHIPSIYLSENEKGRAMYTAELIQNGDVIEVCPTIIVPEEEKEIIHNTLLHDYYFIWPEGGIAIALGYGSIYNHSQDPNAEIIFDLTLEDIIVKCIKDIPPGEEILIDYTGGIKDEKLWFDIF